MIVLSTLGLRGLRNEGLCGSTESLIPEIPTQSERGTIDVVTGRHEWTRLRLFG